MTTDLLFSPRLWISIIPDLICFWLYLLVWLVLPGAFAGWLLNRYFRSMRAVLVTTEAFTLLTWVLETTLFGFDGAWYQLVAAHFLLFIPILSAVFIGYFGSRLKGWRRPTIGQRGSIDRDDPA
jgi:hypothetical protein